MASNHGQLIEFSGNADNWEAYVEQLESYFVANDITTAAKKQAILLSSCGTAAYKTIRSVVAPTKPTEVDYKDLVQKVQDHYTPTPSVLQILLVQQANGGIDSQLNGKATSFN